MSTNMRSSITDLLLQRFILVKNRCSLRHFDRFAPIVGAHGKVRVKDLARCKQTQPLQSRDSFISFVTESVRFAVIENKPDHG